MWNFQGIVFIWTQKYKEIFKSAFVYLWFFIANFKYIFYLKLFFLLTILNIPDS